MTTRTVDDVLAELRDVIHQHRFGLVAISGTLAGWRTHRSGAATADLTAHNDANLGRLRVAARPAAAQSAVAELHDAGRAENKPGEVVIHGHLTVDARWGLQVVLLRLHCVTQPDDEPAPPRPRRNASRPWPHHAQIVGLVAPSGGDDARDDVIAHLTEEGLLVASTRSLSPLAAPASTRPH